jgi:hypothetical protein
MNYNGAEEYSSCVLYHQVVTAGRIICPPDPDATTPRGKFYVQYFRLFPLIAGTVWMITILTMLI